MTAKTTTKERQGAKPITTTLSVTALGGSEVATIQAPAFLQQAISDKLVAQVVHTSEARARIRRAHTKGRSEVRGGGRKPWKQKGTGRSRHGSSRSPIWVGGGITFGPRSRKTVVIAIPDMVRRRALAGVLSASMAQGVVKLIRLGETLPAKTKEIAAAITETEHGVLFIVAPDNAGALTRVSKNIQGVQVKSAADVTVTDVVWSQAIWIDEAAMAHLEARCTTKSK